MKDKFNEMKVWIDNSTYEQLLSRWRHAPTGDEIFLGEIGKYFVETMNQKKEYYDPSALTSISKRVGW